VVLRPAEGLDALAGGGAVLVDVLRDRGRSDERHRGDLGAGQERVHGFLVTVDDVEYAVGKARFLPQLGDPVRRRRVLLRGLEHDGVAGGDGHGEEPHRHHGREVEWRDDRGHAQGLAQRVDVDVRRGVLRVTALEVGGDAAGEFDDFLAAGDLAEGIGDDLAVFGGDDLGQFLLARIQQLAEGEQDARPLRQRGVAPGGERLGGGGDRRFHGRLRTERHLAADDAGGGVRDISEAGVGARGDGLSVDPMGESGHRCPSSSSMGRLTPSSVVAAVRSSVRL
jgi:hypothetical protein